ncbi:BON domain-containing protein [Phenylobacterium sp.]|uniref:BON domain-containing protein n=1 Tax=Phenylobacterium sp. TaxID=1871053 RepID=UPI00121044F3|nr:BON domain-containing protein [Phenylobacterium sp.]THD64672.1 MAG: BON domain-containing protein [Phenylobacterium sp.]
MHDLNTYPIADLRIRVEVQDRLFKAHGRAPCDIAVSVEAGAVRLEGRVFSESEAVEALETAAGVDGVTCVRHAMRIEG